MPRRWTQKEEDQHREQLERLYIRENLTIAQVGELLGLRESGVYTRLLRLHIKPCRLRKDRANNISRVAKFTKSEILAEFVGILLGDGHISSRTGQVWIYNDAKYDREYTEYIKKLLQEITGLPIRQRELTSSRVLQTFVTSVTLIKILKRHGIHVENKVRDQVKIPQWVWRRKEWTRACCRGLFDTDGSIYKLRFGVQISFTNRSHALLNDYRHALTLLGLHPSRISTHRVYVTRKDDLREYFNKIGSNNPKHLKRARMFGIIT